MAEQTSEKPTLCERCQAREATVPFTTGEKDKLKVLQLCMPCVITYHWDVEGRLTGTDLSNLGFPPQPGWTQVQEDVKRAREEGTLRTKEEALEFVKKHPALRIRPGDVRFQTVYAPAENWKLSDPPDWRIQPGYEEEERWWKSETKAGHMVLYGIAIDKAVAGWTMVGWLCSTLEEAERLANASPWVSTKVMKILKTVSVGARSSG